MAVVKVEYNPFLPELNVEINGRPLPEYSALREYRHKPFVEWCDRFFKVIRREVNDQYELGFSGTEFEKEIFEKMARENLLCTKFHYICPELNGNVFSRLESLAQLGDTEEPSTVDVRIWAEDRELVQGMFEALLESGIFEMIQDNVLLSKEYPLTDVLVREAEDRSEISNADLGIILSDDELSDELIDSFIDSSRCVFALQFACNSEFTGRKGRIMVYDVDGYELAAMLEKLISGICLPAILSERADRFSKKLQKRGKQLPDQDLEKMELLCAVRPVFQVDVQMQQDVGRTYPVSITSFPSGISHMFSLQSCNQKVSVDGFNLRAVSPGEEEIQLFADGGKNPVASATFEITERPFIREFEIFPPKVFMGEGDTKEIKIRFSPENSINADEIQIENKNPQIAEIDGNTIRGLSCGKATIRLFTPEAEKLFDVIVQPHLEQIEAKTYVEVNAGNEVAWNYRLIPEDCFEKDQIQITSSDTSVADYQDGYIVGKMTGTAKIFVSAQGSNVETQCQVIVKKRRFFR